jgi:hypothetical protein
VLKECDDDRNVQRRDGHDHDSRLGQRRQIERGK